MTIVPFFLILTIFNFFGNSVGEIEGREGILDKIKTGLQYATNYLDTAKKIADLVAKSLGHFRNDDRNKNFNSDVKKNNNNDGNLRKKQEKNQSEKRGQGERVNEGRPETTNGSSLISAFIRLLGLDSPKITAIAVNSVIFLAQMISSMFGVKPKLEEPQSREASEPFNPLEFIMKNENEKVKKLVAQARDPNLPEHLIRRIDGPDVGCVKLLICKISPIILAAQKSLTNRTIERRFDLTWWLPNFEDFEENSDNCDDNHQDCILFPELN